MSKLIVIDDERSIRNTLKEILEFESYSVDVACDGIEGLAMLQKTKYDAVLCDIKMPQIDGIEVLEKIMIEYPDTPVIIISGHGNIDTAVDAIKKGAYDYLAKPLDLNRVLITLRNALDKACLVSETKTLRKKIAKTHDIIGNSAPINHILEMVDKVAITDARVLITGENGTGKELVARWIHAKSNRNAMPFVEVNCAAIPSELIESELFGHEKGAFTSAIKQKKGKFEMAEGGTLFLDEIGDMSLSAQAKVLRALQENRITRVGGEKDLAVNVRVLAATNKNLKIEIEKGNFREDLYHRLSVILIHVPSLNDRTDDIPELCSHFIKQICEEYNMPMVNINKNAVDALKQINWTGNIREFRNVIERLIILCPSGITEESVKIYAQPLSGRL